MDLDALDQLSTRRSRTDRRTVTALPQLPRLRPMQLSRSAPFMA
jgi:hypothetical protein